MREVLRDAIMKNSGELAKKLFEFFSQVKKSDSIINKTQNVPQYQGCVNKRIKYDEIEDEVKCGKYYLRIWVSQRDQFDSKAQAANKP